MSPKLPPSAYLDMLRAELSYVCSRLHSPHGGSLWDCEMEPCKSIILPALTIGGPAHQEAGILMNRHSSRKRVGSDA